jgi:uncharacterized DUF497 family protein
VKDAVEFDWDASDTAHLARHGVSREEVEELLPRELWIAYEEVEGEPRWTWIGHTGQFRVLVVVWTLRDERIRPITAFEVSKQRRTEYLRMKGFPA